MVAERGVRRDTSRTVDAAASGAELGSLTGAVLGAVLCGGASRRFGSDKALARVDGITLLERTVDLLARSCPRVFVATGAVARHESLLSHRPTCRVVLDRAADLGPLGGLEAVLAAAKAESGPGATRVGVLVVACDLPNLTETVLAELAKRWSSGASDIVLWRDADGVHPLLGCYSADLLSSVSAALDRGDRRLVSFHDAQLPRSDHGSGFNCVRVSYLEAGDLPEPHRPGLDPAANANSPQELAQWVRSTTSTEEAAARAAERTTQ